ncbi:MAG: AbrB/MazE/SpoVT family DNA-binding domain-containing protein [Planctomycetes bacterium]|nr:AbrB/MazE/SpoVT family DNA-binding domain-containing protein [Planctomycetota bacterium]
MELKVTKWGNSIGLRIPKNIAKEASVEEGTVVDVSVEKDRIVLKPVRKRKTLEELLVKVNKYNLHEEDQLGPPAGKEVW